MMVEQRGEIWDRYAKEEAREEKRREEKREVEWISGEHSSGETESGGRRRKGWRSERVESFTGDNYGRIAKRCTTAVSRWIYYIFKSRIRRWITHTCSWKAAHGLCVCARVCTVILERVVHCKAYNGTHPRHTGKRVFSLATPGKPPPAYTRVSVNTRVYARERSYMHRIQVPDYNTIAPSTYR